jgi:signal transduction histidine kinase
MDGLVNGLKNAFESIGPGPGRVVVSVEPGRDGGRAAVVIADDGKGVDRNDGPKLLSAGFTTKPWGHGLGLHSLAVFLSAHNGSVSLESPGKGLGATLRIEVGDA